MPPESLRSLVFIESMEDFESFIRAGAVPGSTVLCCNMEAGRALSGRGIAHKTLSDLMQAGEKAVISEQAFRLVDSWYRFGGLSEYKGLHMGSLFSSDYRQFEDILLFIEKTARAFAAYAPAEVTASEEHLPLIREVIARTWPGAGVKFRTFRKSPGRRIKAALFANPYVRYLATPRRLSVTLNEMRDYVSSLPREFSRKGRAPIRPSSILVTAAHRNEVQMASNPVRELRRRGHEVAVFLIDGDGGSVIEKARAEGLGSYLRPGDLFYGKYRRLYRALRDDFAKRWDRVSGDARFWDSIEYKGVPVLRYASSAKLKWLVTRMFPYWAAIYEMLLDFMAGTRVKAVMAMNDVHTLSRVAAVAAAGLGIPSIDIEHGALGQPYHDRTTAGKWCLWGEGDMETLVGRGIPARNLVVTGNPAHDSVVRRIYDAAEIRGRLGIPAGGRIVLWAPSAVFSLSSPDENENEKVFEALQEFFRDRPDMTFVFKPHPIERMKNYRKIIDRSMRNLVIGAEDAPVDEFIFLSDIVMTWYSSVVTDALTMGKPVIELNLYEASDYTSLARFGASVEIKSLAALDDFLSELFGAGSGLADSLREKSSAYLDRSLYRRDGNASARVADVLEEMMAKA